MKPIFPESPQDWTNAKPNKIYYNSRIKAYTSTVLTDMQVIEEGNLLEKSRTYFSNFVKNVASNLNKIDDASSDLVDKVSLEDTFIDPSPLIKQKLLLSLPESELASIPEMPDKDTDTYQRVTYELPTFFTQIANVAKKFEDYQTQMVSNIFKKNNREIYNDL